MSKSLCSPLALGVSLLWILGCTGIVESVLEYNVDDNLAVDIQLGSQATLPDNIPIKIDDYKMLRLVTQVVNKAEGRRQTRVLIMSSLKDKEALAYYRKSIEDAGYTIKVKKDARLLGTSVVYETEGAPDGLMVSVEREHGKMMINIVYATPITP
jgi:hypothetical protein